ncbi:hypothetical protein [Endozoicomonas sp.]|uniref:hypothetical protein n=1 Tax=Endozoicomonas sp. TaxID=1892382 RepID=UPI00288397B0|nr:hypothetical protein [Endozoicomonas sp.]
MMKFTHKICFALLILTATIFQSHAAQFPNYLKDATELTSKAFQNASPGALLCVVPLLPDSASSGEIVGKVVSDSQPDSFACEYTYFTDGIFTSPQTTREFHWLDATYGQLASWLTSFATIEKSNKDPAYFVLRSAGYLAMETPAICVLTSPGKSFEFGYEMIDDNGHKSCCPYVGAVYSSSFINVSEPENHSCTDGFFSPK